MSESTEQGRATQGLIGRLWSAIWSPSKIYSVGAIMILGIVVGVGGWGGFNWAMELTNTETFCLSCHEMEQNVYREYRGSIHDANGSGVRATCPDCHVPKEWVFKIARKIQASNEVYHHLLGSIDTREKFEGKRLELARNVWKAMSTTDSRECRNCHNFSAMDVTMQRNRARTRHLEAEAQGATCIDCHKGIAHDLPAGITPEEMHPKELKVSGK